MEGSADRAARELSPSPEGRRVEGASIDAFARQAPLDPEKLRLLCPELGTAGLETAEASARPAKGRILKLKLGFNPNSSSVGTMVTVLLWSLVGSGAVLALAASVLARRFRKDEAP